jgi:hypothetical protein
MSWNWRRSSGAIRWCTAPREVIASHRRWTWNRFQKAQGQESAADNAIVRQGAHQANLFHPPSVALADAGHTSRTQGFVIHERPQKYLSTLTVELPKALCQLEVVESHSTFKVTSVKIHLWLTFGMSLLAAGCSSIPDAETQKNPERQLLPKLSQDERSREAELVLLCADVMDMHAADVHHSKNNDLHPQPIPNSSLEKNWDIDGYIIGSDNIGLTLNGKEKLLVKDGQVLYGVVAHRKTSSSEYVVAIRGTFSAAEWTINMFMDKLALRWSDSQKDIGASDSNTPTEAGSVHKGFRTIYASLIFVAAGENSDNVVEQPGNEAWKKILAIVSGNPNNTLVVTGHSLGAPLAMMLSAQLGDAGLKEKIRGRYFAAPRVGDAAFVKFMNKNVPDHWVFNNYDDAVPNVPPSVFGYFYQQLSRQVVLTADLYQADIYSNFINLPGWLACNHHAVTYAAILDGKLKTLEDWQDRLLKNADDKGCILGIRQTQGDIALQ